MRKLGARSPARAQQIKFHSCGPNSPLRGLLFTFEKQGAKYECVVQAHHRVVQDPGALHGSLRAFGFVDGVASLTPTKMEELRAVLRRLEGC